MPGGSGIEVKMASEIITLYLSSPGTQPTFDFGRRDMVPFTYRRPCLSF